MKRTKGLHWLHPSIAISGLLAKVGKSSGTVILIHAQCKQCKHQSLANPRVSVSSISAEVGVQLRAVRATIVHNVADRATHVASLSVPVAACSIFSS